MIREHARENGATEGLEARWLRLLGRAAGMFAGLSIVLAGAGFVRRQAAWAERDAARRDCACCSDAARSQEQAGVKVAPVDAAGSGHATAATPAGEESTRP